MEYLAERLAAIPGVVAVTLGGSRATGTAVEGSDWDFGLYYRGGLDPADITALGWPGRVFAPGEWGTIVNGGAWLTVDGAKVDLIYRDLDEVLRWTAAAGDGRFEIRREVGYVAGIATYILAGELALGRVLAGDPPRPAFPPRLRQTAPEAWFRLAAGALSFAGVYAGRQDRVACLANLCQAVLATGQGQTWTRSSPTSGPVSAWTIPSGRSGRPIERHGYRDGVGEPMGSTRVPRCSAHRLQVPHRRAEPVQRVTDREPVAVPYDVREGSGVPSVLTGAAPGHGQTLRAAKAPVQVAARGLECHRWQMRGGQPHPGPARLQLAADRFLHVG